MNLIVSSKDERLDPESIAVEDDPRVLRTSCRAALLAKEEAEGKAREERIRLWSLIEMMEKFIPATEKGWAVRDCANIERRRAGERGEG